MKLKKYTPQQMLISLRIFSWILFIGLCVDAGSFIYNGIFTLLVDAKNANYFHLSPLYAYDKNYFLIEIALISFITMLRAYLLYEVIQILKAKNLDMEKPFSLNLYHFIVKTTYIALILALLSNLGGEYTNWLIGRGIQMPDFHSLRLDGKDVWLFMGLALKVISQIFNKGVEMQSENELTI